MLSVIRGARNRCQVRRRVAARTDQRNIYTVSCDHGVRSEVLESCRDHFGPFHAVTAADLCVAVVVLSAWTTLWERVRLIQLSVIRLEYLGRKRRWQMVRWEMDGRCYMNTGEVPNDRCKSRRCQGPVDVPATGTGYSNAYAVRACSIYACRACIKVEDS